MIDVVIPVKNGEIYIAKAIESVLAQKYLGKIVVVDDFSNDQTFSIVQAFEKLDERVTIVSPGKHIGLSAARNLGAKSVTADWIAFLDADDTWDAQKLEAQWTHLTRHRECIACFVGARNLSVETGKVSEQPLNSEATGSLANIVTGRFQLTGSASSIIVKTSVFQALDGFDESLKYAEDLDLWARLAARQDICQIPKILVTILVRPDSMQRLIENSNDFLKDSNAQILQIWKHSDALSDSELRGAVYSKIWNCIRANYKKPSKVYVFENQVRNLFQQRLGVITFPTSLILLNIKIVFWKLSQARMKR